MDLLQHVKMNKLLKCCELDTIAMQHGHSGAIMTILLPLQSSWTHMATGGVICGRQEQQHLWDC